MWSVDDTPCGAENQSQTVLLPLLRKGIFFPGLSQIFVEENLILLNFSPWKKTTATE